MSSCMQMPDKEVEKRHLPEGVTPPSDETCSERLANSEI